MVVYCLQMQLICLSKRMWSRNRKKVYQSHFAIAIAIAIVES